MTIKHLLSRATAATALVATILAPGMALAATYVDPYDITVAGQALRIVAGSQYDSLVVGSASFTVTLLAGQTFIVRSPGTSPLALENNVLQPACRVLTTRDNQLSLNGPAVVTVTPSTVPCSTTNYSDDKTPFVSVVSPNGGQTFKSGDTVQIFWSNAGNATAGVRISYSADGGQSATLIADNVINSGFYSWTVPSMPSTTHARIRLDGIDQSRVLTFDLSDSDFAITGTSPEVAPAPAPSSRPPFVPTSVTTSAVSIDADRAFPLAEVVSGTTTCTAGTRIKGASSAAVYYCGRDGKRHGFPNQRVHDSWYQGFTGVVTLSDSQLAAVSLGKNVTYRPGVRMVKIQTDPKVYAVDANGALRWVPDEWTAKRLYGDDWNKKIDDLSDAFFADYSIGEPVPSN